MLLAGCFTSDDESRPPQLGVKASDEQAVEKLGFPSSATRNTVRVGGSDAVSDAAGVAGALYPATGDSDRPTAIVLVDKDDWPRRSPPRCWSGGRSEPRSCSPTEAKCRP